MKSRSHRLQPSDPPDDWISESWTVDCSCGVTFDDGEEMVSCDECGVWVHTRCSHFVKNKSSTFLCHNCNKNNEETEVAQLLVDLPNKTDPCPPFPFQNPVRMWAEAPLAERVHVQGVPGGDSGFFKNSNSIFSKQLWKCSGYVPKKFNFEYREVECFESVENENENGKIESEGADVLFSLSKEVVGPPADVGENIEKVLLSERLNGWVKKERNKTLGFGGSLMSKRERSGKKKKVRSDVSRVPAELKERGSIFNGQINMVSLSGDRDTPVVEVAGGPELEAHGVKSEENKENKEDMLTQLDTGHEVEAVDHDNKPKHIFVIKASTSGPSEDEMPGQKSTLQMHVKLETENTTTRIPSKVDVSVTSNIVEDASNREDANDKIIHDLNPSKDESQLKGDLNEGSCPVVVELEISKIVIDNSSVSDPNGAISASSELHKSDAENNVADPKDINTIQKESISNADGNLHSTSETLKRQETVSLPSDVDKCVDTDVEDDANNKDYAKKTEGMESVFNEPKAQEKAEVEVQSNGSKSNQATSVVHESVQNLGRDSSTTKPQILISQKPRSATTTSTITKNNLLSKDSQLHKLKKDASAEVSTHSIKGHSKGSEKSSHTSKTSNGSSSRPVSAGSKDHTHGSSSKASARDKIELFQPQNGSCEKNEKMSQPIPQLPLKSIHPQISASVTSTLSDQELALLLHQELNSSPRVPRVPRMRQASGVQLISQHATSTLSKRSSSSGGKDRASRRNGKEDASKDNSHNSQESVDETKRGGRDRKYPRDSSKKDSRYRSPDTAVSRKKSVSSGIKEGETNDTLSVRCSPRNGTDNIVSATRSLPALIDDIMSKHNFSTYEELCDAVRPHWKNCRKPNGERYAYPSHSHGIMDCLRKKSQWAHLIERIPKTSSNKRRRKDTATTEESDKEEDAKSKSSSSSKEVDNTVCATRTLRALIDDIMSKYNYSTFEELCDAVRLHWKNCRKLNGLRYAYTSHRQAVMDCLKNKSQWAHLVERYKINSKKKRRKDTSAAEESEEEEDAKSKSSSSSKDVEVAKGDPHLENSSSKGKRNARKRKRLEVQNRRSMKRKHTTNSGSSDSSNDSDDDNDDDKSDEVSSEDESQESVDHSKRENDASDSSSSDDSR